MNTTLQRPTAQEYNEYYKGYIDKVTTNDIIAALSDGQKEMEHFCQQVPFNKWEYRYAEGKWTVKEVLMHIIDTERIMAYRALRVARNDKTSLAGFNQDDYIPTSNANLRTPDSLLAEYKAVRASTLALFLHFDEEMFSRIGTANGSPISPRALAFIIAGHEIHHWAILREKYLA